MENWPEFLSGLILGTIAILAREWGHARRQRAARASLPPAHPTEEHCRRCFFLRYFIEHEQERNENEIKTVRPS